VRAAGTTTPGVRAMSWRESVGAAVRAWREPARWRVAWSLVRAVLIGACPWVTLAAVGWGTWELAAAAWPGPLAFAPDLPGGLRSSAPALVAGVTVCAGYVLVCIACGLRLLALAGIAAEGASAPAVVSSAFFLGLGCLGIAWQYLAIYGVFVPSVIAGACAIVLVAGAGPLARAARVTGATMLRAAGSLAGLPWRFQVLAAVVVVQLMPLFILLALRSFYLDSLAYYAAQAKLIAYTGAFEPLGGATGIYAGFMHLGIPAEMSYAALYALEPGNGPGVAVRLLTYPALLCVLCLCVWVGRALGVTGRWQWMIVALAMSSTALTYYAYGGKTDVLAAGAGLVAIYWLLRGDAPLGAFAVSGAAAGIAVLLKFPYVVGFVPLAITLVAWRLWVARTGGGVQAARGSLHFMIALISVLLLGWTLKNVVWNGDALAPVYFQNSAAALNLDHKYYPEDAEPYLRLVFPLALFFGKFSNSQQHLSPLLLAMAPFLAFPLLQAVRRRRLSAADALASAVAVALLAWVVLRPQIILPRHFLATGLALIPPVVLAAQEYFRRVPSPVLERVLVLLAVGLLASSGPAYVNEIVYQTVPYAAHARDISRYQYAHPAIRMARAVNDDPREHKRVYSAGYITEPLDGSVLADMRYVFVNRVGRDKAGRLAGESPQAFWRRVQAEGVDFVLVTLWTQGEDGKRFFDPGAVPADVPVKVTEVYEGFRLFELLPAPRPAGSVGG